MNKFNQKPTILVVCGRNKRRSRTAEFIFKNDSRFNIKTAGLSSKSEIVLNEKHIEWANLIFVMDNAQKSRIQVQYRNYSIAKINNLEIDDIYEYLNEELIQLLTTKINAILDVEFKI